MKTRLTLLAMGMAMAFFGCATRGVSDEQLRPLQIAHYTENGVITVDPDQVFEK